MLEELIRRNRSYRRFHQNVPISDDTLRELVGLARLTPSGGNRQPLKYVLSCRASSNELIFRHLAWAAYLKSWPGPAEGSGRRPTSSCWAIRPLHPPLGTMPESQPRASFWEQLKRASAAASLGRSTAKDSGPPSLCRNTWKSCWCWPLASRQKKWSSNHWVWTGITNTGETGKGLTMCPKGRLTNSSSCN